MQEKQKQYESKKLTPPMSEREREVLRAIREYANLPEEEKKKIQEMPIE